MTIQENNEIIDVLLERPTNVEIGSRSFSIKPLTFGKYMLMQKYVFMLNIRMESENPQEVIVKAVKDNMDVATSMTAIFLTDDRESLFRHNHITELSEYIKDNLSVADIATLIEMYFSMTSVTKYYRILGIDKEKEKMKKIQRAKDESSSIVVGGVSMFGSLIDSACERYKWTYDYVVWGISYNALQLIMADSVQSVYLSEKEKSRCHISTDGINLSGDDRNNIELIKNLIKGK